MVFEFKIKVVFTFFTELSEIVSERDIRPSKLSRRYDKMWKKDETTH